ncbi:MAG TPA: glycosyltransferase family 4 protein [Elusimicrobiota bacterium]|nr:glycosyltransferase family 4 protein [Elusimicrobiota bacterium]
MNPPRPIHIVQVSGSAQWAGGEVHLIQLMDTLRRRGFVFHVVCPEPGPFIQRLIDKGIDCEMIPISPLGHPGPIRKLADRIRRWNASLVQSHGARSNFYTRLAARLAGVPCLSTVHNALQDYPISAWKRGLYMLMDRATAALSTRTVCVARSLQEELLERIPSLAPTTTVIYNGVDTERFNPDHFQRNPIRESLKLENKWTIGLVGRITLQKGHIYLLEALRTYGRYLPSFKLLIVGDGPLRSLLEYKVAYLGLRQNCRFLGVRQDIPEILSALDLVVLPSLSEGFPYAALESMAMRKPVIATAVNGVPEMIRPEVDGILVPPRNVERLGAALMDLGRHPEKARALAESGYERVRADFSLSTMIDQWEKLYREVCAKRP